MDQVHRIRAVPLLKAIENTLKNNQNVKLPKDYDIIKTGSGRQRAPDSLDWFYTRMASIVRLAMRKGRISLKGLSARYGVRKNRGVRPSGFTRSSPFVNNAAVKELESIGWFDFQKNKDDILTPAAKEILADIMEKVAQE